MTEGRIRALFIKSDRKNRRVSVPSALAIKDGFHGDYHSTPRSRRQILLVSGAVLDELELEPGALSENVTVDGIDVMQFKEGQRLQLGDAMVEVTRACERCTHLERIKSGLGDAVL